MELRIPFGRLRAGFQLHKTIRAANRLTPLRMTGLRLVFFLPLMFSAGAWATTYYVSSSTGNDTNNGSALAPWQTIAHVNGQTFQPGDSILFKRGDIWNESLAPASSGRSGNPITFDAYGAGAAPNLTGYYSVPTTAWVQVTGNAWKAPLPATFTTVNFCLFGSVWGQKVGAATSNLITQRNFYLANGYIYIFSAGNPSTFYGAPIVPMALSNVPVINVNGQSWLTFQHFQVNWFDQYGVYVQGSSDHLVFANMESDSMIPQGTQPLGFYVNEGAPGPGDIKIYNAEAHLNYDAFRFDGAATAITMVNDKAYGNRDGALVDNTSAVSYSYCHFYASSLAVAGSTDVEYTSGTGPNPGAGNIAIDTPPVVQAYQRYPAEVTLTVDDEGMTAGADTYYANTVLPIADAAGVQVGAAITVGYPLAQTLIPEFQGWINAGRDVTSHSISHTYYTNTDALEVQYTGSGTAATLSISNQTLTITVTGAGDSVSYNLGQGQAEGTIKLLRLALLATGKFSATEIQTCQGPYGTGCSFNTESALLAQDLADVSSVDVKSSVYHMQLDVTRLTTDEITLSRNWMTTNLTGLPPTPVYVYPGGYETTAMQGITEGVPYAGARGALKEDLGVKDTYADGFNVQNITSFGVNPSWMGLPPASLNQKVQALIWKESVWGVPWGIFWHFNASTGVGELSGTEVTNLIAYLQASGATVKTNTGLVNWLLSGTQETGTDGNYYYTFPPTSTVVDFRPTKNSPVVDAGQNLGSAYALDINGVNQNSYGSGWEIGAHVYQGYSVYGGGQGGAYFAVGQGSANLPAAAKLPQVWVNNHEGDSLFSYELSLPGTWVAGPAPTCTFHTPYWTGSPTSAGLQSAVNDIEACRTATGVGIALDIPPALYTATSTTGLVIPQSSTTLATNFLILRSTQDTNLPNGQIVCAHGVQDNLATSSDIGLNNADCTGQNMYYELGPQISGGIITGITTLSTNTTILCPIPNATASTLCPITALGSPIAVPLANGYIAPVVAETIDTGANQETVTTASCANQTGMCATFTKTHNSGCTLNGSGQWISCTVPVTYDAGSFTLANGTVTKTSAYNDVQSMWTMQAQSTGNSAAMTFCNASGSGSSPTCSSNIGPDHWLIEDMEARQSAGNTGTNYIAQIAGTAVVSTQAQLSTHIHFRKDWFHGDWTSPYVGANSVTSGLEFDCIACSLVDSQISQIARPGAEHHAVTVNANQVKIDHNHLEGGSIGIFSGGYSGGSGPSIFGWVPLCDGEIRRNYLGYPFSWLGQSPIVAGANPYWSNNFSLVRKNSFEMKGGCRAVVSGNIGENVDSSGGQGGTLGELDPKNNSSGNGTYYLSTLHDVTMQSNIFRNGCQIWNITTSRSGPGGGTAYPPRNIEWLNNLLYSIAGTNYGCSTNIGLSIDGGGGTWQGTMTQTDGNHVTFVANCSNDLGQCIGQISNVTISGGTCGGSPSLAFPVPNLAGGNQANYGVKCSGTTFTVNQNVYGSGYTSTPTPTFTCPSCTGTQTIAVSWNSSSSGISTATGFQSFNISAGDPVAIDNCVNTAFNTVGTTLHSSVTYVPSGIGPGASGPSTPWSGTFTAGNVTVTAPLAGAAGATESSGYCKLTTIQGAPFNLIWNHNTVVSRSTYTVNSGNAFNNSDTDGPSFGMNRAMVNSIFVGGSWGSSAVGTGTAFEQFNNDSANTFTANALVWPGQTGSNYTAYGLNSLFPAGSPTIQFPTNSYCPGSPTGACVGFLGALNSASMPLTLSDYHQFALSPSSVFYAGNADDALDGTAMGANIAAIDAAQTQNLYVCATPCGSTGPYPDNPQ